MGEGEMRTRRHTERPDVLLAVSSCFYPLIFLSFSPEVLVPRMRVRMRKEEGQGNKQPQRENCLPVALARIGRGPISSSPLPRPLSLGPLPGNWASLLSCYL